MRPSVLRGCFQPINSAFSAPTLTKKLTNTPPFAPPPPQTNRPPLARCTPGAAPSGSPAASGAAGARCAPARPRRPSRRAARDARRQRGAWRHCGRGGRRWGQVDLPSTNWRKGRRTGLQPSKLEELQGLTLFLQHVQYIFCPIWMIWVSYFSFGVGVSVALFWPTQVT